MLRAMAAWRQSERVHASLPKEEASPLDSDRRVLSPNLTPKREAASLPQAQDVTSPEPQIALLSALPPPLTGQLSAVGEARQSFPRDALPLQAARHADSGWARSRTRMLLLAGSGALLFSTLLSSDRVAQMDGANSSAAAATFDGLAPFAPDEVYAEMAGESISRDPIWGAASDDASVPPPPRASNPEDEAHARAAEQQACYVMESPTLWHGVLCDVGKSSKEDMEEAASQQGCTMVEHPTLWSKFLCAAGDKLHTDRVAYGHEEGARKQQRGDC